MANESSDDVSVLLNNGDGTFATHVTYSAAPAGGAWSVAAVDLDGDRDLDLAVANGTADCVSVLLNNGDGTFAAAVDHETGVSPYSVIAADLNGDFAPDLAVTNGQTISNNVSVLLNTCQTPPCPADLDGDCSVGILDMLILLGNWTV